MLCPNCHGYRLQRLGGSLLVLLLVQGVAGAVVVDVVLPVRQVGIGRLLLGRRCLDLVRLLVVQGEGEVRVGVGMEEERRGEGQGEERGRRQRGLVSGLTVAPASSSVQGFHAMLHVDVHEVRGDGVGRE